jgi:hypothetical protein
MIIKNKQMPDRDKIVAMNAIMEDVKEYVNKIPETKSKYLFSGWVKNLRNFSKRLEKIESNYITYADRVANEFDKLETRHKILSAAFKLFSFTDKGELLSKKHRDKADRAGLAKNKSLKLKQDGNGNNKDEILKVLDDVISKDFIDGTNYFSNDVEAVARKLKEEISILRGTKAHFMRWQKP